MFNLKQILMFTGCVALLAASTTLAQDQPKGMLSLGIGSVKATDAIVQDIASKGQTNEMNRVLESMDGQLIDRLHNTRKFTIVSRSDLDEIMKEQKLVASGNVDSDDAAAAQAFKLAGCKYLLVPTVDSFQDYTETAHFDGYNESASRRIIQFSCVAKIYDTTTGKLLESANFQLNNGEVQRDASFVQKNGDLSEELYTAMARLMAQKVADRVIDVLRPAKIIARTDNSVIINRGDGTSIFVGQVWNVFAQGQQLTDPDTGASLGYEEINVGKVRITEVDPLFSRGDVIEDRGVDRNQICRLPNDERQPNQPVGNNSGTVAPSAVQP